jgi:hypothetical protein
METRRGSLQSAPAHAPAALLHEGGGGFVVTMSRACPAHPGPCSDRPGSAEVLPYQGEAPVIDGNAQEQQWKAPGFWIQTAALVHEGQVIAGEKPEQNDAVSLSFRLNEDKTSQVRFVLAPEGKVTTPGAAHARCAWSKLPDGYRMECAVPLAELGLARPPSRWDGRVGMEDRDGPGKPLKQLATSNRFIAWSESPPRWDEASRLQSWDPCGLNAD